MKRTFALVLSMVLLVVFTVGATLAWLNDSTGEVKNTFTVGKVDIELTETEDGPFQMIPGTEYDKNPTVKVLEGSETCWVIIEVTKSNELDDVLDYSIDSDWDPVPGHEGFYYQDNVAANTELPILTNSKVTIKSDLGNDDVDVEQTLTFKAYAVQSENLGTIEAAWDALFPATP